MTLNSAEAPFLKIYVAVGDQSTPEKICDFSNKPFGYYNMPISGNYLKFGIYSFEGTSTTYSKNVRFMRDPAGGVPALNELVILKSLRGGTR